MPKPIQISIPKPCHENWENMTPIEKGRFCASCQKQVHDFTNSSDREITSILKGEKNACGRFHADQLERELIIPKEKNKFWIAASSAVIAFIGLSSNEVLAQETEVKTELHEAETPIEKDSISIQKKFISGVVSDFIGPLPGVSVVNVTTKQEVSTDLDGKFMLNSKVGDSIEISFSGLETIRFAVDNKSYKECNVEMKGMMIGEVVIVKKTFFGRIFHSIGNWFR